MVSEGPSPLSSPSSQAGSASSFAAACTDVSNLMMNAEDDAVAVVGGRSRGGEADRIVVIEAGDGSVSAISSCPLDRLEMFLEIDRMTGHAAGRERCGDLLESA